MTKTYITICADIPDHMIDKPIRVDSIIVTVDERWPCTLKPTTALIQTRQPPAEPASGSTKFGLRDDT
jgi:hypothetical protein